MAGLRPVVLVHYHELGLKRGNRPLFLRHLGRNLRRAISDLGPVSLRQVSGRLLLELDEHPAPAAVRDRVRRVCGVASAASTRSMIGRPPSSMSAFGRPPIRSLRPPAWITPVTFIEARSRARSPRPDARSAEALR